MKKYVCFIISILMFLGSSASTYASNEISTITNSFIALENTRAGGTGASPDNFMFVDCPFCGETACLYCAGTVVRTETAYSCSMPMHNENGPCQVETIYCGTAGYCLSCIYNSNVQNPQWPYPTEHKHMEYHFTNGGADRREFSCCIFRS